MRSQRPLPALALAVIVVLAGCGGSFAGADDPDPDSEPAETLTSAPVPTESATPSAAPDAAPNASQVRQPRYLSLRPNCERPPGLVIHIQVAALRNDDPATNAGMRTAWRFTAPSNRESIGSFPEFVALIDRTYAPLLDHERVVYGPLTRQDAVAERLVTVVTENGTTTYWWRVERQVGGEYDGCWMTTSVREQDVGRTVSPPDPDQ